MEYGFSHYDKVDIVDAAGSVFQAGLAEKREKEGEEEECKQLRSVLLFTQMQKNNFLSS